MERDNFNGRTSAVRRKYGTLRSFVGWNEIHPCGDILCISLRNNDRYDLFLMADGVSKFNDLLRKYRSGEIQPAGQSSSLSKEQVEEIIRKILKDDDGIVDSKAIKDGSIKTEDLSDEVKDKMKKTYDPQDETLYMDYDIAQSGGGIIDGDGDVDDEI